MPVYATKDDVEQIVNTAVNRAVDGLSEVIVSFAQSVDQRFDRVEERLDNVEMSFVKLEVKVDTINSNYNRRVSRLEKLNKDSSSSN
jgi:SMC interacting uncharacterized protein involved in chromosome segregation